MIVYIYILVGPWDIFLSLQVKLFWQLTQCKWSRCGPSGPLPSISIVLDREGLQFWYEVIAHSAVTTPDTISSFCTLPFPCFKLLITAYHLAFTFKGRKKKWVQVVFKPISWHWSWCQLSRMWLDFDIGCLLLNIKM